jgi:phosphoribosylanthranilate isomerase
MTLIKICGLMQLSDAPAVNQAQPDFAGFIFVPGKRRQISLVQAAQLRHAGSGKTFDWQQLPQQPPRPFFLAGGLNLTNVKKALTQVQPAGVDISSGVETAGLKDPAKIAAFVQAVRQFDSEVQRYAKN